MELKLVCVLLLAFTLSAEAGGTNTSPTPSTEGSSPATSSTEGSSATPSTEGSSPATSTTEGSSATPSTEGSSPATSTTEDTSATLSTTEDTSATPSTTEDTSATPSTTEDTSATPSTTEDTSATTSTTEDRSATTSTIVGSSATPIKTGASKSTGTTSRVTKAQSTAARKERPTTASPTNKPNFETAQFKIELMVKVNASFDDSLQNASSKLYKHYTSEFKEKVTPVYEKIHGFLYVAVTGFSAGSTNVHHNVGLRADADADDVQIVKESLKTWMENLTIFNRTVEFDNASITKFLDIIKDKCKAEGICQEGLACTDGTTSQTTCNPVCTSGYCNNGVCYVNQGKPVCKCDVLDDVVYGGDTCDVQGTQMSMGTGSIAGIAGGVGGGAILLLSIALGCMCCSRRKGKNPEKDMANEDEVALSERMERDIYSHRQPGQFNYGADIKDEYRYSGRKDEGLGYEEWLRSKERSEHESSVRRGETDFRAPGYSGNWGHSHVDDRRGDNETGRGVRTSGLGTSQYSFPEYVPPDYDQDDKRQIIPHPRDQSRENPYTRMPAGQPPSRPQSSLLSSSYSQSGNVYEHIDTDEPYAIRRPNYR